MSSLLIALVIAWSVTAPTDVTDPVSVIAVTEPAAAPVINFAGRVVERGTRTPVADAEVRIPALGMAELTDADGRFSFFDVPAGKHEIVVPAAGFKRFHTHESITAGERTDAVYYLLPDENDVDVVVVEADVAKKEVSKTTLKREEIRKVAGTNNDAIKVVTVLPGVTVENELSTDLLVRGSGANDNTVELDRTGIPYVFHAGGIKSVVSSDLVEKVDFHAGGFSPFYGDASGGVVAVQTRAGRTDRFGGAVDVNTLLSEAFVEGPVGEKGSFIAAARRSYFDLVLKPMMEQGDEDAAQISVFPQFYDYQLRGDYRLTTDTTVTAALFGADDIMKMLQTRVDPRDPDVAGAFYVHNFFHGQRAGVATRVSPDLTLDTRLAHVGFGQTVRLAGRKANFHIDSFTLTEDATWRLAKRHTLNAGAQLRADKWVADLRLPPTPAEGEQGVTFTDAPVITRKIGLTGGLFGLYAEDQIAVTEAWTVSPGMRFDYYRQSAGSFYADPRLTTRWEVTPDTALKGAIGRYSQFAEPEQLDAAFGTPALDPLHTTHYVAGAEHKLTRADIVGVQGYYKRFENFAYSYSTGERYRNTLHGEAYGVEISARHQLTSRFFGWASYAYSRSFRKYPDTKLWAPAEFDQPHVVNAVASYKLSQRWEVGGKWRLSSGNPYTPVKDRIYLADKSLYIPVEGERYSGRLPSQHRLDARIEYSHPFESWILRMYLEVLNVYAAENAAAYADNYDYTDRQAIALLPVPIPMLGVRGEF